MFSHVRITRDKVPDKILQTTNAFNVKYHDTKI